MTRINLGSEPWRSVKRAPTVREGAGSLPSSDFVEGFFADQVMQSEPYTKENGKGTE